MIKPFPFGIFSKCTQFIENPYLYLFVLDKYDSPNQNKGKVKMLNDFNRALDGISCLQSHTPKT